MLTPRSKSFLVAVVLAMVCACQPPTQFELVMSTELSCDQLKGVAIVAGTPDDVGTKDPATVNTYCDSAPGIGEDRSLGSVMIVPSGARDARVAVRLVAGVSPMTAETCLDLIRENPKAKQIPGCAVARRSLAFLPQQPFALPIAVRGKCVGVNCLDGQTCFQGTCRSDEVDSAQCLASEGCGEGILYSGGSGGGGGGGAPSRTVFVTSQTVQGAQMKGLSGADKICNELAAKAGLPGKFLAWLSTDKESPATRFTKSGPGWALVDGTVVANDWADLTDGTLQHAINLTEIGVAATTSNACSATSTPVWSQTGSDGAFSRANETNPADAKWDCTDWTATAMTDQIFWGDAGAADATWTELQNCNTFGVACISKQAALYCFEQ